MLEKALLEFQKLDPNMGVQTILTFLSIARRRECTQKDIEAELGLTNASASRNVAYWTDLKIYGVPGKGFVDRREDERDRRYKKLTLTAEGRRFHAKLKQLYPGEVGHEPPKA